MQPRSTLAKVARSLSSWKMDLMVLAALTMLVMCVYFSYPRVYRSINPPSPKNDKMPELEQVVPIRWSDSDSISEVQAAYTAGPPSDASDRLIAAGVKKSELGEAILMPADLLVQSRPFRAEFQGVAHPFNMSVSNPCAEDVKLLVVVPSRPEAFDVRTAIRDTWAKDLPSGVAVRFVIGLPDDTDVIDMLMGEQKKHADLILNDIADNYTNLYLKINAAFQWQQAYCPLAKHVLKTDDDTVVDLERLQYWIREKFSNRSQSRMSVFGGMWKGAKPNRDSTHKWYVSADVFPESIYPPYMNGPTYLMSNDAVTAILKHCRDVKPFAIEDILYTGVLARKAGVAKVNGWIYFREGNRVELVETCGTGGVPYVTAIYDITDPAFFAQAYERLRTARCA